MDKESEGYGRALSVGFLAGIAVTSGLLFLFVSVSLFVVRLGPCPDAPEWWVALAQRIPPYLLAAGVVAGAVAGDRSRRSLRR
jgi:hypothetical protein